MKKALITLGLTISVFYSAQIPLTKDYYAFDIINIFDAKDQFYYSWLFNGDSFVMNFPMTKSGLQNLRDKVEYIASLSDVDDYAWDKSIIPKDYEDEESVDIRFGLITKGVVSLNVGYIIDDKEMIVRANKDHLKITITKIRE